MEQEINPPNEFHGACRSEIEPIVITNFVSPGSHIGARSKVWHFAVIQDLVVIGSDCSIGSNAEISRGTRMGDNVRIGHGTITAPNMIIGHNTFIGPNVTFCDDKFPIAGNTLYDAQPPRVGDDVCIGAGAVILPGVRIGDRAIIAAGMTVTKDVERCSVVRNELNVITRDA